MGVTSVASPTLTALDLAGEPLRGPVGQYRPELLQLASESGENLNMLLRRYTRSLRRRCDAVLPASFVRLFTCRLRSFLPIFLATAEDPPAGP